MSERKIRLTAVDDVREFVKAADKCDFDIDLSCNHVTVDAKSIMGVMSMDLTQVLTVRYDAADPNFEKVLDKFACAV